jgi:S-adenosyl-L-methionine hydrolase (adenosine-forming)
MPIVTLITDYGEKDYFVGALKGALLSACPSLIFVDLTHQIQNFNIVQAAYCLRYAYRNFPEGSIHIISVNDFYQPSPQFAVVKHRGHYFIAPNHGVFSLLFDEMPAERYFITTDFFDINTHKKAYQKAVAIITSEQALSNAGDFADTLEQRFSLQAVTSETQIRSSVIHIDHYENVILNITRDVWERYSYYRRFTIFFKRNEPISELHTTYSDVPVGETLCLFNGANHLEIAINMGKAASLLSMEIDDTVYVEFY